MPVYRMRYVCETSLQFAQDLSLNYRGKALLFLFSKKKASDNEVHLVLDIESTSFQDADVEAQRFLQPSLDALSFSTGTPLLVLHWDFITKDETGSTTRRAIWCEKRTENAPLFLTDSAVNETQQILDQEGGPDLELCWHR